MPWPIVAAICGDGGDPRGGVCLCHAERPEGRETNPLVRLGIYRRNLCLPGGRRDRNARAARGSRPWPRLDPDRLRSPNHLEAAPLLAAAEGDDPAGALRPAESG